MKEMLVEMDRIIQEFKGRGRLFVRRHQGVHGQTRFTVCDEPEPLSTTDMTASFTESFPEHLRASSAKRTHLERGGLNRWDFKRKKR